MFVSGEIYIYTYIIRIYFQGWSRTQEVEVVDHFNTENFPKKLPQLAISCMKHQNPSNPYGCFRKQWYPQIIHRNRVSIINHPFCGTTILGNIHIFPTTKGDREGSKSHVSKNVILYIKKLHSTTDHPKPIEQRSKSLRHSTILIVL